eukprot:scaffold300_cov173-Ochromonas_danica.AAC.16
MTESNLKLVTFRDASEGYSGLIYSDKLEKWFCGGSLGQGFEKGLDQDTFQPKQWNADDKPITALAIHDEKRLLAHAAGDSVTLRSFDDLDELEESMLLRRTLPITHLAFMTNGEFM